MAIIRLLIFCGVFVAFSTGAQTVTNVIDRFDPSGIGTNNYASGQITNIWGNWFGDAFQSVSWDAATDANTNAGSGALKIVANFPGATGSHQFEIFNGFNGVNPPVNGIQFTNFQCDVRFAAGSATNSSGNFGFLQFGTPVGYSQDYFSGGVSVAANNTNWVHVSLPLNAFADINLQNITGVLIHIYDTSLSGQSTLWVDNICFVGMATNIGTATMNYINTQQRIDGFGASCAWMITLSPADADLFFSTNIGIGLSLLRTRIAPTNNSSSSWSWEAGIAQMAQARGARVWSTPWSPPANFKNTNTVNGGAFASSTANYQGYAARMANYVATLKNTYGINLFAVSVQNEPDYEATYESCLWTGQQIHDFIPYLSAALAASNVAATKIMLPEDAHWQWNLATNTMSDTTTSNLVGILAAHNYASSAAAVTNFGTPPPKTLWETEHYLGTDDSITNGLALAQEIHSFMTVAQVNAYNYWWLIGSDTQGIGGTNTTTPPRRLFVMGNYSKFIRPNFYRVGLTNNSVALVTAYKDSASTNFVIVAANPGAYPVNQTFALTNFPAVNRLTPWATTAATSLGDLGVVNVTNGNFNYLLPPWSVISFSSIFTSYPTNIFFSRSGANLTLNWPQTHLGWTLQMSSNALATGLGNNWTDVANSATTNQIVVPINPASGTVFYRLRR
jgi:glucuronoarabinoxylan endo-1,4-beta-xylanase